MNIKQLKKELGLKDKNLAEFFGLNPVSYYKISARKRYEESFIQCIIIKFKHYENRENLRFN